MVVVVVVGRGLPALLHTKGRGERELDNENGNG